jgi:glucose-1-phosphate thymidylyltransferase
MVAALRVRKGIVLAGGDGTRMYPTTQVVCKQLLPVYDKPMIYYPLSTLMHFGIRDVLVISTPKDIHHFNRLFGDGDHLGLRISYSVQEKPQGIAQAFIIGEKFIAAEPVALILGDNIFYGVVDLLPEIENYSGGALIFGYYMKNPQRYGVLEFDDRGGAISIEEKPTKPRSNYAVTGFYIFDHEVVGIAKGLKPSARGELEITDVNNEYLKRGRLKAVRLGRGIAWLDTGTHDSMLAASNFIETVEKRQGVKIGCVEEIAYRKGFIDRRQFQHIIDKTAHNSYREYLEEIIREIDRAG